MTQNNNLSKDAMAIMEFESKKKSAGIAYALWFFLGWFGIHNFYLARHGWGICYLLVHISIWISAFVFAPLYLLILIVWFVDLFMIPKYTENFNRDLRASIVNGAGMF